MEALEGLVVGELKDLSYQIVKGKRTKRQKVSPPIPFTISSSANLSRGEGGGDNINEENITAKNTNNGNEDDNNKDQNYSTNIRLFPTGSSDDDNSTTTEDEDAARLLILLSQGKQSSTRIDYLDHNYSLPSTKFTSKKYIETSSNGNGKLGMFVYECKTCNRTFSSFQALGGHRASHRKPKNIYIAELKRRPISSVFSDDYDHDFDPSPSSFARNNSHVTMASPISYHAMTNKATTSPRVHECSYCGAEFTSGQALGGHMRRHRGSNGNNNSNYNYRYINNQNNPNTNNTNIVQPVLALSPSFMSSFPMDRDSLGIKKQKINSDKDSLSLSLSLDLNLPAPPPAENGQKNQESTELEHVSEKRISPSPEKKNEHQHEQQQKIDNKEPDVLLAITPTLVDCQY